MAEYKLMYFNARGRGEPARLLFAQAGVEYEDVRMNSEELAAIKGDVTKVPLGQLPVLIVKGHPPIPQSHSINRYLARKFGMYGQSEAETVRIDVTGESVNDIFTHVMKMYFEKDEAKKAELGKSFVEKDSVTILTAMCNALKKSSEGKGYFVGNTMTLADIAVFCMTEVLFNNPALGPVLAGKYPLLKEFDTRMRAEPKIAAWLAKRPKTDT